MAKIKLSEGGFSLIPEGTTTFKIVGAEYDEDFGKMVVDMQTKDGKKHSERFMLLKKNGEANEGALKAFSYFAKTALNNFQVDEIDHEDIIGCYITATVKHEDYEYEKDGETKRGKSARLNDYAVAVGFGTKTDEDGFENIPDGLEENLDDFLDS